MFRHMRVPICTLMIACVAAALFSVTAGAAVLPAPRFDPQLIARPSNFAVGTYEEAGDAMEIVLTNIGGAPVTPPVEVKVQLDAGVIATQVDAEEGGLWPKNCSLLAGGSEVLCVVSELRPFQAAFQLRLTVSAAAPSTLETLLTVSGGGAPEVQRTFRTKVDSADAPFAISSFESEATGPAGESDVRAGGHPTLLNTLVTEPMRNSIPLSSPAPPFYGLQLRGPIKNGKDLIVDLPMGMVGNPTAAPRCPIRVFLAQALTDSHCPAGSQVGTFVIPGPSNVFMGNSFAVGERNPIYNLVPEPGYPAELGFFDRGLTHGILAPATLAHTSQGYVVRVIAAEMVTGVNGPYFLQASFFGDPQRAAGLSRAGSRAFLTNPAECSGRPLRTELHLDTWSNPAPVPLKGGVLDFAAADFSDPQWYSATAEAPPVSGCEALQFNPSFRLKSDATSSDSPSGLGVEISVPQNEESEGRATPPLRDATVALPRGLVVNPSSADGLAGCTAAQLAPASTEPGACPDASKLGTVTLQTALIDHQLEGSVYLGTPECSPCGNADATEGRLLKLYIEIDDPSTGVVVKLPGSVSADPGSGQLTATFRNNPQLPFEDLELHFRSGQRAPLTTPVLCGGYTTTSDLTPWSAPQSGPDAMPQSRFDITSGPGGSGCPASETGLSNSPRLEAGTSVPLAGTYSPFIFKINRENGSQRIASIDTTLPEGLVGKLAGIPYCPDAGIATAPTKSGNAERANPSCPLASEVGVVNVGAGSGAPFVVQGHAYLAGPYKGAPLSLEIITPAVAGPFDLGTVAVRTALYVDEYTAQIHAVSDQIPSILAGIPLDIRSITLDMNRPQFTLNPTSCNAMKVLGSTTSTLGVGSSQLSRFQVGGCKGLAFKPQLKLSLKGATRRSGHPALKAVVTYPKGGSYANIARAQVGLPHSEFLDQGNLDKVCKQADLKAGTCPKKSIYGKAKAWTPLLDKPLEGPVYLGVGFGYKLPALVADLNGQVRILLKGKVDTTKHEGIRNTFEAVPDAPVSRFVLEMKGGKKYGLLENSENICRKPQRASALFSAHNGASLHVRPKIANSCKQKRQGRKKGK